VNENDDPVSAPVEHVDDSLDPLAYQPVEFAAPPADERRRVRWRLIAGVSVGLAVVAIVGAASIVASREHDSAKRNAASASLWRGRADTVRATLLTTRTQLDAARAQIGDTNTRLQGAQRSIRRLERRQRTLVNEKDQIADQRLALEQERKRLQAQSTSLLNVANGFIECSNGMSQLVQALAVNDVEWASANYPSISSSCDSAKATLDAYNASL
jgi:hypothetical protein